MATQVTAEINGGPLTNTQAVQIAHLLNQYNELQVSYNTARLLHSSANYYPLHLEGLVFGSVAVQRHNFLLSEIRHLVIHPLFRHRGLARRLLDFALERVDTPLMYASIREKNEASIALFTGAGFKTASKADLGDHKVLLLLKNNGSWVL